MKVSEEEIEAVFAFAERIAKAFDEHKSSHVMFFMQQAFNDLYEDGLSWENTDELLKNIVTICSLRNKSS